MRQNKVVAFAVILFLFGGILLRSAAAVTEQTPSQIAIVQRTMMPDGNSVFTPAPRMFKWTRSKAATRYRLKLAQYDKTSDTFIVSHKIWIQQPASGWPKWMPPASLFAVGKYRWSITDYSGETPGFTAWASFQIKLPGQPGMVLIPAGSFSMGDNFNEGESDEQPAHTVAVSAFYMDRYEVKKALWDEVMNWSWTEGTGYSFGSAGAAKAANHPVYTQYWYDLMKWCNARSQKEGRSPVYYADAGFTQVYKTGQDEPYVNWDATGYRLPAEAEWEKAARGGSAGRRFPWSDTDSIQHARANYYSWMYNSYDTSPTRGYHPAYHTGATPYTSPVGRFAPNAYGVYDMAGNLYECCWDWYDAGYYASSPATDPRGPDTGSYRVLRGGGCGYYASEARVAHRQAVDPNIVTIFIGFRCVRKP